MNRDLLIHLDYCLTPTMRLNNAAIVISDERIFAVGGFSAFTETEQYELVEMTDCYALPGFVDTHIYGAGGFDCMHADTTINLDSMSMTLAEHGVTTFIPTTQSASPDKLQAVVTRLADACDTHQPGAIAAGIHIEGPFLSLGKRGAHSAKYIRPISLTEAEPLIKCGRGHVKIFTFAPELDNSLKLVELLCHYHVTPAMGHTLAGQDAVMNAIERGARRCSHIYNGMEPLQQRRVGLAAIAMIDDRLWVELIVDGVHIHQMMIDLACRCIAKDKLVCISNSTEAGGLSDGRYRLGDDDILVEGGVSTLADTQIIAGATQLLDDNFRHLLAFSHLSETEAAAACTLNPARSVGLNDRGEIKPGKRADIVILDRDHNVQMTIVGGRIVYRRQETEPSVDSSVRQ